MESYHSMFSLFSNLILFFSSQHKNIDECYEWLQQNEDENGILEDDLVLGEEGLTWEVVGNAVGLMNQQELLDITLDLLH